MMIECGKPGSNIIIEFLQSGNNDPVVSHSGYEFRHRVRKIGKGL